MELCTNVLQGILWVPKKKANWREGRNYLENGLLVSTEILMNTSALTSPGITPSSACLCCPFCKASPVSSTAFLDLTEIFAQPQTQSKSIPYVSLTSTAHDLCHKHKEAWVTLFETQWQINDNGHLILCTVLFSNSLRKKSLVTVEYCLNSLTWSSGLFQQSNTNILSSYPPYSIESLCLAPNIFSLSPWIPWHPPLFMPYSLAWNVYLHSSLRLSLFNNIKPCR